MSAKKLHTPTKAIQRNPTKQRKIRVSSWLLLGLFVPGLGTVWAQTESVVRDCLPTSAKVQLKPTQKPTHDFFVVTGHNDIPAQRKWLIFWANLGCQKVDSGVQGIAQPPF